MDIDKKIEWLRQRLTKPLPGISAQERMAARVLPMPMTVPENARNSAVLCTLYPVNNELNVLLMKRREDSSAHSGQVSFPGGRYEPFDTDLQETALREAEEEMGLDRRQVDMLGALTSLYIPVSNFQVFPFVGFCPARPSLKPSRHEVANVMEIPVAWLLHADRKATTDVVSPAVPGIIRKVKAYILEDGTVIWGATAMILSELEAVLDETPG